MFFPLSLHHKSDSRVERKKVIESFQILSLVKKRLFLAHSNFFKIMEQVKLSRQLLQIKQK